MKVRIKKRFRDIDTRKIMFVGEFADYADDRAEQLAMGGFVIIEESQEDLAVVEDPCKPADANDENTEKVEQKEDVAAKAESEHVPKSEIPTPTPTPTSTKRKKRS